MEPITRAVTATLGGRAPAFGTVEFATPAALTAPRARRQLRLFPLGYCGCEHVIPAMADMEPCPDCMEAYEPHDCPLMVIPAPQAERAA